MYVVTFDSVLWDVSENKLLEDKLLCQEPFFMIRTLVTWECHRFILLKSLFNKIHYRIALINVRFHFFRKTFRNFFHRELKECYEVMPIIASIANSIMVSIATGICIFFNEKQRSLVNTLKRIDTNIETSEILSHAV